MAETNDRSELVSLDDSIEPLENDIHFEPIIQLPEVEVSTKEEDEIELIKLRAKLFRFDTSDVESSEWKERGTGEVKILKHKENNACRVVMRRDKTFKICANHFITPWMSLKPSFNSDRAWVWTVAADFADETAKRECLAIRFANSTIANQWKDAFDDAKRIVTEQCELYRDTPPTDSTPTTTTDSGQSSESDSETPKRQLSNDVDDEEDEQDEDEASSTEKETDAQQDITKQLEELKCN